MLKARINGVELEGTPEQIAEAIRLLGAGPEVREFIQRDPSWKPHTIRVPLEPWAPNPKTTGASPYDQCPVTCDSSDGETITIKADG